LIVAFSSGLTEEQANSLNNPSSSKKLEEKEKESIQTASSTMKKTNVSMNGSKSSFPMKSLTSSASNHNKQQSHKKVSNSSSSVNHHLEAEEERTRFDRWKLVYPFYNSMRNWLENLYFSFSSYQSGIFRYSFKNLSDFRQKLSLLWFDLPFSSLLFSHPSPSSPSSSSLSSEEDEKNHTFFSLYHLLTDSFLFEKGFFYSHYKAIQEEFKFEFNSLFDNLKEFLEVFVFLSFFPLPFLLFLFFSFLFFSFLFVSFLFCFRKGSATMIINDFNR
jgi:hypothetical protein